MQHDTYAQTDRQTDRQFVFVCVWFIMCRMSKTFETAHRNRSKALTHAQITPLILPLLSHPAAARPHTKAKAEHSLKPLILPLLSLLHTKAKAEHSLTPLTLPLLPPPTPSSASHSPSGSGKTSLLDILAGRKVCVSFSTRNSILCGLILSPFFLFYLRSL